MSGSEGVGALRMSRAGHGGLVVMGPIGGRGRLCTAHSLPHLSTIRGGSISGGMDDLGDWREVRGAIWGREADGRSGSRRCGL